MTLAQKLTAFYLLPGSVDSIEDSLSYAEVDAGKKYSKSNDLWLISDWGYQYYLGLQPSLSASLPFSVVFSVIAQEIHITFCFFLE